VELLSVLLNLRLLLLILRKTLTIQIFCLLLPPILPRWVPEITASRINRNLLRGVQILAVCLVFSEVL
jgi:hypothetical protein